jgi:hypothetical protein
VWRDICGVGEKARIAAAAVQAGIPLPIVYRQYMQPDQMHQSSVVFDLAALRGAAATPGDPLVVWCGTRSCLGKGKSSLLRDLFFKHNSRIDINDVEFGSCDGRGGTGTTHDKVRIRHRMICFSNTDHLRQ